jgi:hypothetical protein
MEKALELWGALARGELDRMEVRLTPIAERAKSPNSPTGVPFVGSGTRSKG